MDLNDPAFIADPYPTYAQLRDAGPVHHVPSVDVWLVPRYEDVVRVLRDPTAFSSDLRRLAKGLTVNPFNPAMRVPRPLAATADRVPWGRVLLTSDPPDHTVLRRKISTAFTPRRIAELEPRIREIATSLVDRLRTTDRTDVVRDLASPLPTMVIAELLGVPAARHDDFKRWSDDLVGGLVSGGGMVRMARSAVAITVFFAGIVRQRRRDPDDDLVSALVTGREENRLSARDIVTFCVLLLVAGNETTTNLVANAVLALCANPDEATRLQADPSLAGAVVEETLRYDGPAQGLLRVTTADVSFGPDVIPAGAKLLPLVGSANRDPGHFADPDRFDIDRDPNDHVDFGSGIHHCIGAPLARLEASVALETLYGTAPPVRLSGAPTRVTSPVLRGLTSLPVELTHQRTTRTL